MRGLIDGSWRDALLDYDLAGRVRIRVRAQLTVAPLRELYFHPPYSARLLWNYLGEVGPAAVLRRIRSRRGERLRNQKYLSAGWGTVLEAGAESGYVAGEAVIFIATCHPLCVERLVLDPALVTPARDPALLPSVPGHLVLMESCDEALGPACAHLAAYSPDSGRTVAVGPALRVAETALTAADWSRARALPIEAKSEPLSVRARPAPAAAGRPAAALFGYGNFAKTTILPNVVRHLDVMRVHEIDPTQIPAASAAASWDTSPVLRDDDVDAVFIAGYHHTHATLAADALRRGMYAVCEKPIAVNRKQLAELVDAVRTNPRYFACFQRRYHAFNQFARRDLGIRAHDPVSYHCIVHEVPLPAHHWYRWPSSRTRLLSNGCHWVDHFLFLNGFAEPRACAVEAAADGTLSCTAELVNGAFFTMTLTDRGSSRLGVQDHVQLHARGGTVRITNTSRYEAETDRRIVRRTRQYRVRCYADMYSSIGAAIAEGRSGDSLASVEVSGELAIALDEKLHDMLAEPRAAHGSAQELRIG